MNKSQPPEKPDFEPYQPGNIPLYQAIYGENLISLGGIAAVDNMFSGLPINHLKALDLGAGLGGVAFHLADKYQMNITGIEIQPWMAEYAREHAPRQLAARLQFDSYHANTALPYQAETFDLVYSKGVLNHIAEKDILFNQIYTILKPAGIFVIADWIFPHAAMESTAPLVCETQQSYENLLMNARFDEISFRNDSPLFRNYAKNLLSNLANHKTFIEEKYGQGLFDIIWKQHEELINKIDRQEKFAVRIVAKKISTSPS